MGDNGGPVILLRTPGPEADSARPDELLRVEGPRANLLLRYTLAPAEATAALLAHPRMRKENTHNQRLSVSIAERPSPAIEAIAYFCVAELLANATKHSGADRAMVSVTDQDDERLLMTITDNGSGGARLTPGGGLAGLLERVQTVDGRLAVDSPAGGPTIVTIELPSHA
jgi:signal transduction histidine kinase